LQIPLKEGIEGESRPKDRVTFWLTPIYINFVVSWMQAVAVEGQEQSLVTDYVMKVGEHGFWVGYVNQVWN
jgi:hypothetical protein